MFTVETSSNKTLNSVLLRASSKTQEDGRGGEKKEGSLQEKGQNINVLNYYKHCEHRLVSCVYTTTVELDCTSAPKKVAAECISCGLPLQHMQI